MATALRHDFQHDPALKVWVLDDRSAERTAIARSFQAIGAITEKEGSIPKLGERVRNLENPEVEPPAIIVIDQHWIIKLSNLALLDRPDIAITSHQSVGMALGEYFRSIDDLDDSILLMTSVNEEEVAAAPVGLGPAVAVPKARLHLLPGIVERGGSQRDALASIGIETSAVDRMRRTRKLLEFAAKTFGFAPSDTARLAGTRIGVAVSDEGLRDYLWSSRDAHDRASHVLTILTLLREAYGETLPPIDRVEARFELPFSEVMLNGSVEQLIRLRSALETKAGGPLA